MPLPSSPPPRDLIDPAEHEGLEAVVEPSVMVYKSSSTHIPASGKEEEGKEIQNRRLLEGVLAFNLSVLRP